MKILYLDTSSSFFYCGVVEDNKLLFDIKKNFGKDLSKYSLDILNKDLIKNGIDPVSINKIILVNGPGSFTGVRIAVTIAKTLAWALRIPVITISSLQAMACSTDIKSDYYIPLIDARRGYCYAGIYDSDFNSIEDDKYISIDCLIKNVKEKYNNYVFISNDNFEFNIINYSPNILKIIKKVENNKPVDNVHFISPCYLKLTEAEEKINDSIS